MKNKYVPILALLISLAISACASTSVSETTSAVPPPTHHMDELPQYEGVKTIVAILPLGLSERAAKRYPKLLEKSVGLGIHNLVLEALFETNRFRFVEEKPEITKDIMDRQWLSASGFFSNSEAVSYGKMLGAEQVVYGEIYDYAEGGEKVTGLTGQQGYNVTVGVQIVCTDVETGEKLSLGTSRSTAASYGDASRMAIEKAVYDLVKRLK